RRLGPADGRAGARARRDRASQPARRAGHAVHSSLGARSRSAAYAAAAREVVRALLPARRLRRPPRADRQRRILRPDGRSPGAAGPIRTTVFVLQFRQAFACLWLMLVLPALALAATPVLRGVAVDERLDGPATLASVAPPPSGGSSLPLIARI